MLFTSLILLTGKVDAETKGMQISSEPDFSQEFREFSPEQTVYVRAFSASDGSRKRELNLRDNEFNLVENYQLENKVNDTFTKEIILPKTEGYFSLEARIESEGHTSSYTKSIQVGNPSSSKMKVDIEVSNDQKSRNSQDANVQNNEKKWTGMEDLLKTAILVIKGFAGAFGGVR